MAGSRQDQAEQGDQGAGRPWAHPYADFLDRVEKPARYAGGEVGSVVKDWSAVEATVCLAFPDVYDVGMSHLGFRILYRILNEDPRTLAERAYCPWVDLEAELRARGLGLVSLESHRPLCDFDGVGFSLQHELTYANVLTMLELGGLPLRAAERGERAPLVVAGGPGATHPEPLAPFVDAFAIGDGEAKLTELALCWARLDRAGATRAERLRALARLGGIYVPALYEVEIEPAHGLQVVRPPASADLPFPVARTWVDLGRYPFPEVGPTGGPEAIFDRASIEIARGCSQGCRFCQAGMIYRPVRERDPLEVCRAVWGAVRSSGSDEVSLTALSPADVSYLGPLLRALGPELAAQAVSLSISSLRAYGLRPELLGELRRQRPSGLTFAPEAGTQRLRDAVNKNVTDEQLAESVAQAFAQGFERIKLYFMIGLPTEGDEDVAAIAATARRCAALGRRAARRRIELVTSVSNHVPKPHTPFQWEAMDSLAELERKQARLRAGLRAERAVRLRTHDARGSVLEAILARGDRRMGEAIERAWRAGARFDSWDEHLRFDLWEQAFAASGIDPSRHLGALPVGARLPWSHIDVGLAPGFLERELRRALRLRRSPPCGPRARRAGQPQEGRRRPVCYACGLGCDLDARRAQQEAFAAMLEGDASRAEPSRAAARARDPAAGQRYRLRFEKLGPATLLGHLDLVRELPRVLRRADVPMVYTLGYHPKPAMSFGPALPLGCASLDEHVDVRLLPLLDAPALTDLVARLNAASPAGLNFLQASRLAHEEPGLGELVNGARYVIAFARAALVERGCGEPDAWLRARCEAFMASEELVVERVHKGGTKTVDLRAWLREAAPAGEAARRGLARAGLGEGLVAAEMVVAIAPSGTARPGELAAVLGGQPSTAYRALRLALLARDGACLLPPPGELSRPGR
ncbi:MAG: TIGR03960 family B12-binding radical SAM protein [Deltaproteobacteria bacterium]|nr:TIGR03960 family B12-binding radical SAM protein [Deltaproteobacteria bacterium]